MDSFNSHFTILDLVDHSGNEFSVLFRNDTGTVINHDIKAFQNQINETTAKNVPISEKNEYYSIVLEHFIDKPNVHDQEKSLYLVSPSVDLKGLKVQDYKTCSICFTHFLTGPIVDHIIQCFKKMSGETLSRSAASKRASNDRGFCFITNDGRYLYVLIKPRLSFKIPPPPLDPHLCEDGFVGEYRLDKLFEDKDFAIKCQIIPEVEKLLSDQVFNFLEKKRPVFASHNPVLLLFNTSNIRVGVLSTFSHKRYSASISPVVFLLAVVDEEFAFLLEDFGFDKFNKVLFEKLCADNNHFMSTLMKAIYYCFIDPVQSCYKTSYHRCNIFKSMRCFLNYIVYDGLVAMNRLDISLFKNYENNILVFENAASINMSYHQTLPQNDIIQKGHDTVLIGGARFSVSLFKQMVLKLFDEYNSILSVYLPPDLRDIDSIMTIFTFNVKDDHSNTDHGYTPFDTPFIVNKKMEYLDSFKKNLKGYNIFILTTLLRLSNLVALMIQLTVGPPYRIAELSHIRYRNVGNIKRSLLFCPEQRTFDINLTYNNSKSPSHRYNSFYKSMPPEVAKYLVHLLVVIRPIVDNLLGQEPPLHHLEPIAPEDDIDDLFDDDDDKGIPNDEISCNLDTTLNCYAFVTVTEKLSYSDFTNNLTKLALKHFKQTWRGRTLRQALYFLAVGNVTEPRSEAFRNEIIRMSGLSPDAYNDMFQVKKPDTSLKTQKEISTEWHLALGFGDPLNLSPELSMSAELRLIVSRQEFLSSKKLMDAGRDVMGKAFSFCSQEVERACLHIYSTMDRVLVNTPTGSGKSLTYLLPAWLESKAGSPYITVVVIPSSQLDQAYENTKNILSTRKYQLESDANAFYDTEILIVEMDKYPEFTKILRQFETEEMPRYIRRIVIVDFHLIARGYYCRPYLMNFINSFNKPFSFVFLSATVNQQLFQFTTDDMNRHIECFKERTVNRDILHTQVECTSVPQLVGYIKEHELYGKIVILINNKPVADSLAAKLGCLCFSAKFRLKDPRKAQEVYDSFKNPTNPGDNIIVCTSAFSIDLEGEGVTHAIIAFGTARGSHFQFKCLEVWNTFNESNKGGFAFQDSPIRGFIFFSFSSSSVVIFHFL